MTVFLNSLVRLAKYMFRPGCAANSTIINGEGATTRAGA